MTRNGSLFHGMVFIILNYLAISSPSFGQSEPDIDGIDTDSGETEIELEYRHQDLDGGSGADAQIQVEHALSDRWAIGGEVEFEREPGDPLLVDSAVGSVKWRAPRKAKGVAFALQGGAGYNFQKDVALVESAIFLGFSKRDWALAGKFDVEQLVKDKAHPEFGYRLRLSREFKSDLELGIESAGDLFADSDPKHRIGPYLELPLGGDEAPVLEIGAFAGLTKAEADVQYRVEIQFEF